MLTNSGKCCMPGKNRLTSYLLKKSVKTNTMSGVTITRSLIPRKHGQKSHHRHLATLWSKCSKTNSNQINKYDKKALSYEFLPTAKGFLNNMDFFRAKRSLDSICDECLNSRAYIGKTPFGGYATTREYAIFPSLALNALLHLSIIL